MRTFTLKIPTRNFTIRPSNRKIYGDATANRVIYDGDYNNTLWLNWGQTTVYPFDPLNPKTFGEYP